MWKKLTEPIVHICSDCLKQHSRMLCSLALTELTPFGEAKCLYGEMLALLGGWLFVPSGKGDPASQVTLFNTHGNGLPRSVRKCSKRRRVTLPPGASFLHINGTSTTTTATTNTWKKNKKERFYEQNNSSSRFLVYFCNVHCTTTKWNLLMRRSMGDVNSRPRILLSCFKLSHVL